MNHLTAFVLKQVEAEKIDKYTVMEFLRVQDSHMQEMLANLQAVEKTAKKSAVKAVAKESSSEVEDLEIRLKEAEDQIETLQRLQREAHNVGEAMRCAIIEELDKMLQGQLHSSSLIGNERLAHLQNMCEAGRTFWALESFVKRGFWCKFSHQTGSLFPVIVSYGMGRNSDTTAFTAHSLQQGVQSIVRYVVAPLDKVQQ